MNRREAISRVSWILGGTIIGSGIFLEAGCNSSPEQAADFFDKQTIDLLNEIAETIRNSSAKDFGIASIFPYLDEAMRIAEESNLLERERKTDLLKWSWIDENTIYKYFSIENIFAYLLQTEIIERWMNLNQEFGKKVFKEFIDKLRGSFQFPDEYKLIK